MNRFRKPQIVPGYWINRSRDWAMQLAEHYAAGGSPRSRARSGNRGTERNIGRLTQGKVGECALALLLQLDPERSLNWQMYADAGTDIVSPLGIAIDVKTTFPNFKLIWSNNVNDLYHREKRFDVLVSVSILDHAFENCWIEGYVLKDEFFERKQIADGTNCGLEPDTWFMEKSELANIEELINPTDPDLHDLFAKHGCGTPSAWREWDRRIELCELVQSRGKTQRAAE